MLLRVVVATAPLFAACAAMLGIEELPLAARDAGVDATDVAVIAAPDACDAPDASFCARACGAFDFCDDFEDETVDFDRWHHPEFVPVPFRSPPEAFGASAVVAAGPSERGNVLFAQAESTSNTPAAIWLFEFMERSRSSQPTRGVAMRVKAKLLESSFPADPPGLSQRIALFGIGIAGALPAPVTTFVFYDEGPTIGIGLREDSIPGGDGAHQIDRVDGVPRVTVQAFTDIDFVVGPRSSLIANHFPCTLVERDPDAGQSDGGADASDAAVAPDPIVVFARALGFSRCVALSGELAVDGWYAQPVVLLGMNVSDYGRAKWAYDDVAARYLH